MKKLTIAFLLSTLATVASAEIVTNSKGDRIELKENGTWALVPWTDADFVNDGSKFTIEVPDGNKKAINIEVTPDVSLMDNGRKLQKKYLAFQVRMASISARYKLKNPYSYAPKSVSVKQRGNNVSITIGYTGKNSYGGDVSSYFTQELYLEESGILKEVS